MLLVSRETHVLRLDRRGLERVEMMKEMLIACHDYFKKNEDSSSVSLRDIKRFNILYDFFKDSQLKKRMIAKNEGK